MENTIKRFRARRISRKLRQLGLVTDVWAMVTYTENLGYEIRGLYDTKNLAEDAAHRERSQAFECARHEANTPFHAAFATPVERGCVRRGTPYYAMLKFAPDRTPQTVRLYQSAGAASSAEPDLSFIGGPVILEQPAGHDARVTVDIRLQINSRGR